MGWVNKTLRTPPLHVHPCYGSWNAITMLWFPPTYCVLNGHAVVVVECRGSLWQEEDELGKETGRACGLHQRFSVVCRIPCSYLNVKAQFSNWNESNNVSTLFYFRSTEIPQYLHERCNYSCCCGPRQNLNNVDSSFLWSYCMTL